MERLTNPEIDYSAVGVVDEMRTGTIAGMLCRLAAYEDTGLEPEEVKEITSWSYGPFHKKMGDWLKAEQEGRLVVLPCKVGDTVYRIASGRVGGKTRASYSGAYVIQEFKISCDYVTGNGLDMFAHMILDDGRPATSYEIFSSNNIGKTVFLTREEAEKALKGV